MAPPPPANLPLGERLLQLVQTLQFGWFVGHVTLLICTLRYSISYITFHASSGGAVFSYRVAFVAAAFTYGIVVYKGIRARARAGKSPSGTGHLALLTDENVQYLLMALVWLYTFPVPLALLPFAVYSVFHVATYTRTNLLPTLQPATPASTAGAATSSASPSGKPAGASGSSSAKTSSPLADTIGRFVKQYYDASMTLVAALEIALWFRVLLSALSFAHGSWILLVVYTIFFRSRYSQSAFVQGALHGAAARVDALVADQRTPPAARQAWHTLQQLVRQATDATDLRKYAGAPPVQKRQ